MKACSDSKDSALGRKSQGEDLAEPEGGSHNLISAGRKRRRHKKAFIEPAT